MRRNPRYHTLRLLLGDQLNDRHSWFGRVDPGVLYLIAELRQETGYVRHHVQKVCAFFAAMTEFAAGLRSAGHSVDYLTLEDTIKYKDLSELVNVYCDKYAFDSFEYQAPDEYRLQQQLQGLDLPAPIRTVRTGSEHFLLARDELGDWVEPGRHNRMEFFYRRMRRHFGLLMDGDRPCGGRWNFDQHNRQSLRAADLAEIPPPLRFDNDVSAILDRLDAHHVETFGRREKSLLWPVNRAQALKLLEYFCTHCLMRFGRFQDAMSGRHVHGWTLYHSRLSFALNVKLLEPMEVMRAAIECYRQDPDRIGIAQVEGFVRQILGWREYVRAVYWVNMPAYAELNELQAERNLPHYFWDGETRMNCMRHALGQSLDYAYAHHIQRLMISGNFCLLAGIDPAQVDAWYLGVYVDAIEWVEMPNTRGMSQFADGGLIATKPYGASASYINRMSDYCADCEYDCRERASPRACPFNSLYWHFMQRHRPRLGQNPRSGMIYRNWDRQDPGRREKILQRAEWCLEHLDEL